MSYYVGIDVGTSSVRAALCDNEGKIMNKTSVPIDIWNKYDMYEQSSENIWQSCVEAIKIITSNFTDKSVIKGIGFDATCSLVALDANYQPVSVSCGGELDQNIIMWMDHRAKDEAEFISSTKHPALECVGGKIFLEMQLPKLLWLKKNLPESWEKSVNFLDLADFMTFKATGSLKRSLCSVVCKWLFIANDRVMGRPDVNFLREINLEDLEMKLMNNLEIGQPGEPIGDGLNSSAATQLGLNVNTPVGISLIDAHAGTLGLLGCETTSFDSKLLNQLVIICGTSSCHMTLSKEKIFTKGVWGPYYSVILPNLWLNEGGQSATGKLIDHIIETHSAYAEILKDGDGHVHEKLNQLLLKMSNNDEDALQKLTSKIHVCPDFHGNRSPFADPERRGMISGLTLDSSAESLALLYLATIQAIAYGSKHIMESLKEAGQNFSRVILCGGLTKNKLFTQTHSDVMGLPVYLPEEPESVLLGSCMLAAKASGDFKNLEDAMLHMGGKGYKVSPQSSIEKFHAAKYKVFLKLCNDQQTYNSIMASSI